MALNGVDVASWQAGINFANVQTDFVIVKATGGKGYINPYCDAQYQSAKKSGKLLGVYHYANEKGFEGTAEQEAQFFLDNIKGYIGEAILILDWESSNKHDVGWAKRWLDYVQQKTGIKPLFYTYTAVLNSFDFSSIANADYGLWVANYGTDAVINGFQKPNPPVSPFWKTTAMYQYSSNTWLSGYGARIDANVFYGDANTWKAYAGIKTSAPEQAKPETPKPEPSKPNVLTAGSHYSAMGDGKGNWAHLEEFGPTGDKLKIKGWHVAKFNRQFIIIWDRVRNIELGRIEAKKLSRPDVNAAYKASGNLGFDVLMDLKPLKGHSVIAILRSTNDPEGNEVGGSSTFFETRWYHDI